MGGLVLGLGGDSIGDIRLEFGEALLLGENPHVKFRRPEKGHVLFPASNLGERIFGESLGRNGVRLQLIQGRHLPLHDRLTGLQLGELTAGKLQGGGLRFALLLGLRLRLLVRLRARQHFIRVGQGPFVILHLGLKVHDAVGDPVKVERRLGRQLEQGAPFRLGGRQALGRNLDFGNQLSLRFFIRGLIGQVAHGLELLGCGLIARLHGVELLHHLGGSGEDGRIRGLGGAEISQGGLRIGGSRGRLRS